MVDRLDISHNRATACNDGGHLDDQQQNKQLMITIFHSIQPLLQNSLLHPTCTRPCLSLAGKEKPKRFSLSLGLGTNRHPHPQNLQMSRRYPHLLTSPRILPHNHLVLFGVAVFLGRRRRRWQWRPGNIVVAVEIAVADEGVFEAVLRVIPLVYIPFINLFIYSCVI